MSYSENFKEISNRKKPYNPSYFQHVVQIPAKVGNRNFVLKKFLGKDSERFSLFRGRKCSFQGIPRFMEESMTKLRTDGKYKEKLSNALEQNSKSVLVFLFHRTEFRAFFYSA
jgi:hypothetical protein